MSQSTTQPLPITTTNRTANNTPSTKWNTRLLRSFLLSRTKDEGIWVCEGSVVALATGRTIANMKGYEQVKMTQPLDRQKRQQTTANRITLPTTTSPQSTTISDDATHIGKFSISRQLYYTDTITGRRLDSFRFRPTSRARKVNIPEYTQTDVEVKLLQNGKVELCREKDGYKRIVHMERKKDMQGCLVSMWQFIGKRVISNKQKNVQTQVGTVEQWQYIDTGRQGLWSWSGIGKCPAWYGGGMCAMYLSGRRVKDWQQVGEIQYWTKGNSNTQKKQTRKRFLGII